MLKCFLQALFNMFIAIVAAIALAIVIVTLFPTFVSMLFD